MKVVRKKLSKMVYSNMYFEVLSLKINVTWLHLSLQVFTRKTSSEINVETLSSFETRLVSFKNCLILKFRNLHLAYLHPFML